jgi:metallo-beta-lactamase family protein
MQITFLGAADTVTGSRHLIDTGNKRLLLDCGLFQGFKALRERNWIGFEAMGIAPRSIDAVVLSHAHLDHSGYLPALVKEGFAGPIYCTQATRDLAEVMLLDSAHLQEEDARRANRYGYSRHAPALPLYTRANAVHCLSRFKPLAFAQPLDLGGGTRVTLTPAGHLLGAAAVRVQQGTRSLVFSGDLGRFHDMMMPPPEAIAQADVLLVESTYGNRLHPADGTLDALGSIIVNTSARGGTVLLPSFAVGRAQALLLCIQRLKKSGVIAQNMPVFLDSPMSQAATRIYTKHGKLLSIPAKEIKTLCEGVTLVEKPQDSERLSRLRYPSVIISSSGMATGGRVLHHLKTLASDARNHVVFPGFQVAGTRGAKLVAGAREVRIFGEYVQVKAQVSHLEGLSAHADATEIIQWLRGFKKPPEQTYVVHGEPEAADAMRTRIEDELGWKVKMPQHLQTVAA